MRVRAFYLPTKYKISLHLSSMSILRKIELGILSLFFILMLMQLREIEVSSGLIASLVAADVFWLFNIFALKGERPQGFKVPQLIEKLLISCLFWGICMNVSGIHNSALVIKAFLFLLSIYFLIEGIVKMFRKGERLNGIERILLSMVLAGTLARFLYLPGGNVLTVFGMFLIMLLCFGIGIALMIKQIRENQKLKGLGYLFIYLSLGIGTCYVLFDLMHWLKSYALYHVAMICILNSILILQRNVKGLDSMESKEKSDVYHTIRRMIVYTAIVIFINVLTVRQFFRMKYGNYPRLIEAEYDCRIHSHYKMDTPACKNFSELHEQYRYGRIKEE